MLSMDVFKGSAFSAISLTGGVDKMAYTPGFLGAIPGLVTPRPVRTKAIWIEERENAPRLIQTSPRGSAPNQRGGESRDARAFKTVRLAHSSRIHSDELQDIREFQSETELKQLQKEVARRQFLMKQDFALTRENMLFGLIQGKVVDANGAIINDWFEEFEQPEMAPVEFDLTKAAPEGDFFKQCNVLRRQMTRNLQGVGGANVVVHAITDDVFWDEFTQLPEVRKTYALAMQAMQLQNQHGAAWESFRYGNVVWHNYRGSDDGELAVAEASARFFPVSSGIFQCAQSPGEKMEFVNTLGQDEYSWVVTDKDRDMWADIEMYSYPLYVCTMPQALGSGVAK